MRPHIIGGIASRRRGAAGSGSGGGEEAPFSAVELLINAELDASPSDEFFDASSFARTITRNESTTVRSAAAAVFGSYGINAPAAGRIDFTIGAVANWKFLHDGTQKWTIDMQWDPADFTVIRCLFDTGGGTTANAGIFFDVSTSRVPTFQIYNASGSLPASVLNGTFAALANDTNPRHLRLSYDPNPAGSPSENAILYERGIFKGAIAKTNNAPSSANPAFPLRIGGFGSSGLEPARGSFDEIRVIKGYALGVLNQSSAWPTS